MRSAGAMFADAVVARPIGAVIRVLGTAALVLTLSLSALGGNLDEAADMLVLAGEGDLRALPRLFSLGP
ncbi:MAG: hypothetical protein QF921_06270 [Pseudomonadales bacterium]|jgi:hypothetical protein|nr:hypothetical protein [Pseudomonadales bacterium]MDP6469443.1 hypothetical protein [Pseudomonadales bacterium]MDP6827285.1 hypothetical protein [Pseudomonadales bacterium]MDP6971108.1 hypothetical protein [Pseudomonadales bacterium]|tara:strand:+ start:3079 stop:3285 length:207 start_codon:yes stop_codon:yes gene_type:complete